MPIINWSDAPNGKGQRRDGTNYEIPFRVGDFAKMKSPISIQGPVEDKPGWRFVVWPQYLPNFRHGDFDTEDECKEAAAVAVQIWLDERGLMIAPS